MLWARYMKVWERPRLWSSEIPIPSYYLITCRMLHWIWEFPQHWSSQRCSLLTSDDVLDTQAKSWTNRHPAAFIWLILTPVGYSAASMHPQNPACLLIWKHFLRLHPLPPPSKLSTSAHHPLESPQSLQRTGFWKFYSREKRKSGSQKQNAWCSPNRWLSLAIITYFADEFITAPPRWHKLINLWIICPPFLVLL